MTGNVSTYCWPAEGDRITGQGYASTLDMTDTEKRKARKRRPVGFAPPKPAPKPRVKPKARPR